MGQELKPPRVSDADWIRAAELYAVAKNPIHTIAAALAAARREGMEEAAKIAEASLASYRLRAAAEKHAPLRSAYEHHIAQIEAIAAEIERRAKEQE